MIEVTVRVSFYELCHQERLEENLVIDAVEYGIAEPVAGDECTNWVFDTTGVYWLKKAVRLYYDLEIDWVAVAMLIDLLRERETLRKQNDYLTRRLSTYVE